MRILLRTLWKDMIILRWWLLAWAAAVAAFAVWRDGLAVQWDAAPFEISPHPDTVQKVLLGFAVVIAVRTMHTDKLQGELAFWRTRPAGAMHLAAAKIVLVFLWLFLLPCAVEAALLRHWGWNAWLGPCLATWAITLAAVLIPALCVAAIIPAPTIAIPAALLAAWLSYQLRPGRADWTVAMDALSPAFLTFYTRALLGLAFTLAAAASHGRTVTALLLMLLSFPKSVSLPLPEGLNPLRIETTDGPEPAVMETSRYGDRVYLRYADPNQPVWAAASGPATLIPDDGSGPVTAKPPVPFLEQWSRDMVGVRYGFSQELASLALSHNMPWGEVFHIQNPDFDSVKPGRVMLPVMHGTLDDSIYGELPLNAGSTWQQGPFRITLTDRATSKSGPAFKLRIDQPAARSGQWRTGLYGTAPATTFQIGLINRRLGLSIRGYLDDSLHGNFQNFQAESSRRETFTTADALHRKTEELWFIPDVLFLNDDIRDFTNPDSELFRDATLVFAAFKLTCRGTRTLTLSAWPPTRPIPYSGNNTEDRERLARAREELKALTLPPLDDESAVTRYVDELIRLRELLRMGYSSANEVWPHFEVSRFTPLGSRWLPLIIRRIAVNMPGGIGGYDFPARGERSEWIDLLASRMAEPSHEALLMQLMRGGLPLHRTIKAHEWFRRQAIPELAAITAQFDQGSFWLSVMVGLNDPALHPAIIASFRTGSIRERTSRASEHLDAPGFPRDAVLAILQSREAEMLPETQLHFAFVQSLAGIAEGPRLLASMLTGWPDPEDAGHIPFHRGHILERLQKITPECPADGRAAIAWLIANGPRLQWTGSQWRLPEEAPESH